MSTMYRISRCASATRSLHVKSIFETGEGRGSAKRRRGVGDRRKTTSRRGQGRRATPARPRLSSAPRGAGFRVMWILETSTLAMVTRGVLESVVGLGCPTRVMMDCRALNFFVRKNFPEARSHRAGTRLPNRRLRGGTLRARAPRREARTRALARGRRVGLASHTLSARLGAFVRPAAPARVPSAPRAGASPRSPAFPSAASSSSRLPPCLALTPSSPCTPSATRVPGATSTFATRWGRRRCPRRASPPRRACPASSPATSSSARSRRSTSTFPPSTVPSSRPSPSTTLVR